MFTFSPAIAANNRAIASSAMAIYKIPKGTIPRECRGCNALIWWVETKHKRWIPVDISGEAHFVSCPQASRFRRPRRRPDKGAS
ncbi:hypothetical protein [Neosynechococcus sphagnicola]|uniref:hypothetical protein n=1 Tax=Neosynechococcus sphagnicola TaxID=1501145 RepID=UPI0012E07CE8|nr:hypothetical protein [Neosynechococcus sphagnicola]